MSMSMPVSSNCLFHHHQHHYKHWKAAHWINHPSSTLIQKIIYSWLMAFGLTWPVASQNQCLGQSPSSWLPKSEAWAIGHSKPPYGSSLAWLLMPGLGWLLAQSQGREITKGKCSIRSSLNPMNDLRSSCHIVPSISSF